MILLHLLWATSALAEPSRLGDIDGDGIPTAADLVHLLNHINRTVPLAVDLIPWADINEDSRIDDLDVTRLGDAILGITPLPNPTAPPILVSPIDAVSDSVIRLTGNSRPGREIVVTGGAAASTTRVLPDGTFSIPVPLSPNRLNRLFLTATNATFPLGASLRFDVVSDQEPPTLQVDFPADNSSVLQSDIVVLGRVGDLLSGSRGISVTVSNATAGANFIAPANVHVGLGNNGTFERGEVALTLGTNLLVVTARDALGNSSVRQVRVQRDRLPEGPQLTMVSGDMQGTNAMLNLRQPLVVRVSHRDGRAIAGKIVNFEVSRSDGHLSATPEWTGTMGRRIQVLTDTEGLARVWWMLGSDAGCANNRVTVSSRDIAGTLLFCASATPGPPRQVNVGSGNNQAAEPDGPAPEPLRVWVTDGCSGNPGIPITFRVISSQGLVNGHSTATVITSRTGHAQVSFVAGSAPGICRIEATFPNNPAPPAVFTVSVKRREVSSVTRFIGIVLDSSQQPVVGARCHLVSDPTSPQSMTDQLGRFELVNIPPGPGEILVDCTTATAVGTHPVPAGSFGAMSFRVLILPNTENSFPGPIFLPRHHPAHARMYDGTKDVDLTMEGVEGFRLRIRAGSMRLPDGTVPSLRNPVWLSVNPIHYDKMPMPIPDGAAPLLTWGLEPMGATFDPPVEVQLPNVAAMPPGAVIGLMSFTQRTERFEVVGTSHVTEDGALIVTDPGSGITVAGCGATCPPYPFWGSVGSGPVPPDEEGDDAGPNGRTPSQSEGQPSPNGRGPHRPESHTGGDPILLASGEFVLTEADLSIPGRGFPFELIRTYRSRSDNNGPMGYGWDFNSYQRLDLTRLNAQPSLLQWQNGFGRVDTFSFDPEKDAYIGPPGCYVMIRRREGGGFLARDRHGFKTEFDARGYMRRQIDRNGNTMEYFWNSEDQLMRVIDTLGRPITFTYNARGRLKRVTDFTGREIVFSYTRNGDLKKVRSPLVIGTSTGNDFLVGKTTQYQYSVATEPEELRHNLVAIIDPRGQRLLQNTYGESPKEFDFDRVIRQVAGRVDQVYTFQYSELNGGTLDPPVNLARSQTLQIDPNGNRRLFLHNAAGNLLEERIESNRDINSADPSVFVTRHLYNAEGERIETIFPEGNSVRYRFDEANADRWQQGNLVATTLLPGPRRGDSTARVVTHRYEPIFNQIRESTDERGNLATFVPPNGGPHSPARYTTQWIFDYQEGNSLNALAAELGRTPNATAALLSRAVVQMNLGDLNSDGAVGQIAGNPIVHRLPSVRLLPDSNEAAAEGTVEQPVVTFHTYNRFGQRTTRIDPEGNVEDYIYHPESDPDGDGVMTASPRSLAADTGGYLEAIISDARQTSNRRSLVPPARIRTENYYDRVGNRIRQLDGRGRGTLYEFNALNQLVSETSRAPFQYLRRYHYDANDNLILTETQNVGVVGPGLGVFAAVSMDYDINNNQTRIIEWPSASEALVTRLEYDRNDNLIRTIQPAGNVSEAVYDERDLLFSFTRGAGTALASTRRMTYDGNGNLIRSTGAEDHNSDGQPDATRFEYDGYDQLKVAVDAVGNRRELDYDPAGNVVRIRRWGLNGGVSPSNNSGAGNVLLSQKESSYDELNRLFQSDLLLFANQTAVGPEGPLTPGDGKVTARFEHNRNSRLTWESDDNRHERVLQYDGMNRLAVERDHLGNERRFAYDANHNLIRQTDLELSPEGLVPAETIVMERVYDELDRLVTVTDNLGNATSYTYDSRDNLVSKTDALGNSTHYIHDGLKRKLAEVVVLRVGGHGAGALDESNPNNADAKITTRYGWDSNSRLATLSDDLGNTTVYGYDPLNRKTLERFANVTQRIAQYDRDDNLVRLQDQNGSVVTSSYDAINRLIRVDIARGAGVEGTSRRTYEYDGISRLTRSFDNNDPVNPNDDATIESRFDSLGRQLVEIQNGVSVATVFDGVGNRLSCTYPDGRIIETSYDELNRPRSIRSRGNASAIVEYRYLGTGRVLERIHGNGTRQRFHDGAGHQTGYDAVRRPVEVRHQSAGGVPIVALEYAYDRADNRRYERDLLSGTGDAYEYDSRYRLTRVHRTVLGPAFDGIRNNDTLNADVVDLEAAELAAYDLDGAGNWRQRRIGGTTTDYDVNELNEYTTVGGKPTVHEANGNLLREESRRYSYDFANRLVRVFDASGQELGRYTYDTLSRRVSKTTRAGTTSYFYDGLRPVEERSSASLARQYVHGRGLDEVVELRLGGAPFHYHHNSLGSVVALTDAAGNVVERYDYDEYGTTTVLDPLGTPRAASVVGNPHRYTGRWHDEESGLYYYRLRYYHPGTGRFLQRDPLGYLADINLLAYTGNNPANWTDPLGLERKGERHRQLGFNPWNGVNQAGRDALTFLKSPFLVFGALTGQYLVPTTAGERALAEVMVGFSPMALIPDSVGVISAASSYAAGTGTLSELGGALLSFLPGMGEGAKGRRILDAGSDISRISSPGTDLRAIAAGAGDLSASQSRVLAELSDYGSSTIIRKSEFGLTDLAALSARTGDEFAMLTTGGRRMIMRGDYNSVPITPQVAGELSAQGWRWSAHTHPDGVMRSSQGDRDVLFQFENQSSVILNSLGSRKRFTPNGDMIDSSWLPR